MDAKTYLKISAINLTFLLAGVLIGAMFMSGVIAVHAQGKESIPTHDTVTTKVDRAISVTRPKHENGTPRGFCFAEVPREELGKALACDGMDMGGRQVHIEEATSRSKP